MVSVGSPGLEFTFWYVLIVLCISFHCQNPESAGTLGFSATLNCRNPILQYFTITFTSFQSERIVLEKKRIRVVIMDIFREGFFSVTLLPQGLIHKTEWIHMDPYCQEHQELVSDVQVGSNNLNILRWTRAKGATTLTLKKEIKLNIWHLFNFFFRHLFSSTRFFNFKRLRFLYTSHIYIQLFDAACTLPAHWMYSIATL